MIDLPNRPRRNRKSQAIRNMVRETQVQTQDLIFPFFMEDGKNKKIEIESMPGIFRETEKTLADQVKQAANLEIPAVILFGVSHHKDFEGSDSFPPTASPTKSPTSSPVAPTAAPVEPTDAPVEPTDAPVAPTDVPVPPTEAPFSSCQTIST